MSDQNDDEPKYEMSREMAFFLSVLTLNIGGSEDQAGALKGAEYQIAKIEDHGNNCWPPSRHKRKSGNGDRRGSSHHNREQTT